MRGMLLACLVAASAATAAAAPRAAAAPAFEAPTASDLRRIHNELLPHPDGEQQQMTEDEAAAQHEAFFRARGGRTGPIWQNHSHAERTDNLQRHVASRRSQRRRVQWFGAPKAWESASEQARSAALVAVLDAPSTACDDALATNTGQALPCSYDCTDLVSEYFPPPQSQTTRCFLFDPDTETWPESGGQGADLLDLRQQRFETQSYVGLEAGTNPEGGRLEFSIGVGRVCSDITITSTFLGTGETHTEVVCLVDGEHEYNHTITDEHTVEVVGYAESDVHVGAGGTTSFVVGRCTDVLIRVTTASSDGSSIDWSLDDGGHNGPWVFSSEGTGVTEYESCMFDNDFTLTRQGG